MGQIPGIAKLKSLGEDSVNLDLDEKGLELAAEKVLAMYIGRVITVDKIMWVESEEINKVLLLLRTAKSRKVSQESGGVAIIDRLLEMKKAVVMTRGEGNIPYIGFVGGNEKIEMVESRVRKRVEAEVVEGYMVSHIKRIAEIVDNDPEVVRGRRLLEDGRQNLLSRQERHNQSRDRFQKRQQLLQAELEDSKARGEIVSPEWLEAKLKWAGPAEEWTWEKIREGKVALVKEEQRLDQISSEVALREERLTKKAARVLAETDRSWREL